MDDEDSLIAEARQMADEYLENNKSSIDIEPSDGDSESDCDDYTKNYEEYTAIIKEIEVNKYLYDKYVRLCSLSHDLSDLTIIRESYNKFAEVYPLSAELWLKYIKVEVILAQSESEIKKVEELFRKALSDYYSVSVALEFGKFASRCDNAESIWCEILGSYGLHTMQGREVFQMYRRYILGVDNKTEEQKQAAFIESYLQELKYPLYNMAESYIEFKVFFEKNKKELTNKINWAKVDENYFKAKDHMEKVLPFEEQLVSLDEKCYQDRAALYISYIKESDKFLNENSLQIIYERMVADCCLNPECWLLYIDFIDFRDEFERPRELYDFPIFMQTATYISSRALRNCTWSEKLYINRMNLFEKHGKPREDVQTVLESAMSVGFQTPEPAVAIWLEYLTYLRRNVDWQCENDCEILRKNFGMAWSVLGQQWSVLADCDCEILQFWGRLEYGPLGDYKRGKELWTTVMDSSDNALKSGLWIEFAQLESKRNLLSTRELYRKALNVHGIDNPYVIASAWQRFERCNGTIKSVAHCMKECSELLATTVLAQSQVIENNTHTKIKKITSKQATKRKSDSTSKTDSNLMEKKKKTRETSQEDQRTKVAQNERHDIIFKEHEDQEIDLSKDHLRIFLSNLDYSLTREDILTGFPGLKIVNVNLITSANGKSRGFAYLELEDELEVEKALAMDRLNLNGRPVFVSSVLRDKEKRQKFKYSDGLEPNKLFIKGLPHDTNKEELEQIFGVYGKIKAIRLVHHKSGKFKNIAYVEYEDDQGVKKAVLTEDQKELRGCVMTVAISAPPPKSSTSVLPVSKLLGVTAKRNKTTEQKPRMSLIPNVVRKNLNVASQTTKEATNGATISKTNEDFRKLLNK
ncbi:squamous cell carcinoma antigen recognized by T-cells 3 isoform X2 [Teleopsis dalmanni]|nr:squamous cell carcinoma antigen recognized by T-cells 3 isoform X2 [Teleopsis dalmanni]